MASPKKSVNQCWSLSQDSLELGDSFHERKVDHNKAQCLQTTAVELPPYFLLNSWLDFVEPIVKDWWLQLLSLPAAYHRHCSVQLSTSVVFYHPVMCRVHDNPTTRNISSLAPLCPPPPYNA